MIKPKHSEPSALLQDFAKILIRWQKVHGRHDLPWQNTSDPYRIWLSEIMLQQTQVETVIPYFNRFLARFPSVQDLARAPEEQVMAHWSGLGYYARARNMHKSAQIVVAKWGGQFPADAAGLETLPGVGRSTAAAIASFAYGHRTAILDGNVKRVLCRVFGIHGFTGDKHIEAQLWQLAEQLLPACDMSSYTQAQMDFGALLCKRTRPGCAQCPLQAQCYAYGADEVATLPTPRLRKALPTQSWGFVVLEHEGQILLTQRPSPGIWGGLWSLPVWTEGDALKAVEALYKATGLRTRPAESLPGFKHSFTHLHLQLAPQRFVLKAPPSQDLPPDWRWCSLAQCATLGVPTPVRSVLSSVWG